MFRAGGLSWRRLDVLVRKLPVDSATARSVYGDEMSWTAGDHLLATAVDALMAGNWQRGGGRGHRPKPIPRPGHEPARQLGRTSRSPAEVRAYLDRFRPQEVAADA